MKMQNVPRHILDTFASLWPALRDNPLGLAARLQRRRRALLTRPPRAWCIALRSGDTRITPWNTTLDDCHAMGERLGAHRRPHTVTVDAALIDRLCRPVYIQPPGELARDVAARLGVHVTALRYPIHTGLFTARREKAAHGHGRPSPLIDYPDALDPQSYGFRQPCPGWGEHWKYLARAFPADFAQPIRRHPEHRDGRWGTRFAGWLWHCPACDRPVPNIYFPLPVPSMDVSLRIDIDAALRGEGEGVRRENDASSLTPDASTLSPDALLPPPPTFACGRCHRVTNCPAPTLTTKGAAGTSSSPTSPPDCPTFIRGGREVPKPTALIRQRYPPHQHQTGAPTPAL